MKNEDKQLLRTIEGSWGFVSHANRQRAEKYPPRPALRRLIALGFIEVRTVTISNWLSDPRIAPEHRGPTIEARLTAQGADVRTAQDGGGDAA